MRALIWVDLQYDFLPGGALAVSDGDAVLSLANALIPRFDLVVATQDWHPKDHQSFASQHPGRKPGELTTLGGLPQVLWPEHCVQGSKGAELEASLDVTKVEKIFRKGMHREVDSYSGFFDNGHQHSTGMGEWLRERGVTEVSVLGLATDYCVKFTALDARTLGFDVSLIEDACRGVELSAGDVAKAIVEMRAAGVVVVRSGSLQ
jgi:nicotinamidase/pyrazinamidase